MRYIIMNILLWVTGTMAYYGASEYPETLGAKFRIFFRDVFPFLFIYTAPIWLGIIVVLFCYLVGGTAKAGTALVKDAIRPRKSRSKSRQELLEELEKLEERLNELDED